MGLIGVWTGFLDGVDFVYNTDAVSRQPNYKGPNKINEDVTVWLDQYFCDQHTSIHIFNMDSIGDNLDSRVKLVQYQNQDKLKQWAPVHNLSL